MGSLPDSPGLDGPADLVVEVISPESRARDRGEKFHEYEQAGVREYWLIDLQRRAAVFYVLGSDASFRLQPLAWERVFQSKAVPSLWLRVDWLFAAPLTRLADVLREWALD